MRNQPPDKAAIFALAAGIRTGGEEQLRPVEYVNEDGDLGLDQRLEMVLQDTHDVV